MHAYPMSAPPTTNLHVLEVFCDTLVLLRQLAVLLAVLAVTAAVLALEVEQHIVLARQLALLLVDGGRVLCIHMHTHSPVAATELLH